MHNMKLFEYNSAILYTFLLNDTVAIPLCMHEKAGHKFTMQFYIRYMHTYIYFKASCS